jgi:hypothetical protein
MSTEYIWFKNGKESRRTVDEAGEKPTLEKLPNGVEIRTRYKSPSQELISVGYYKGDLLHRDGDEPAYTYYIEGKLESESYYKEGVEHRDGDKPAYIAYMGGDGEVTRMTYYKNGVRTRVGDKPYDTGFYRDGDKRFENYGSGKGRDGRNLHREGDKPAITYWNKDGSLKSERWYLGGWMAREGDKPVSIEYDTKGRKKEVIYKNKDGEMHRDTDNPSVIEYDAGKLDSVSYYKNGERHRDDDKPAYIAYKFNGIDVDYEEYFMDGDAYTPKK